MPSPTDHRPTVRRYRCARGHFLPADFQPPATDPDDWDDECQCKPQTISLKERTVTGRQIALDTQPRRIQRRRTKGWRAPDGAVYVGRGSRWGNPCTQIRTPALDGSEWEREGRLGKTSGERHAFVHPDKTITYHLVKDATREQATQMFRQWLVLMPSLAEAARAELAGRDLMCWCPPDEPCHADVLLAIANSTE
ncbi:DUF4326 domain-containing protein [Streptomyces tendae]|uniref:DUF4326 domain-containing protein n=1 Tax=Streptomyces tendae TaxID=1932 RepID=UPI0036A627CB